MASFPGAARSKSHVPQGILGGKAAWQYHALVISPSRVQGKEFHVPTRTFLELISLKTHIPEGFGSWFLCEWSLFIGSEASLVRMDCKDKIVSVVLSNFLYLLVIFLICFISFVIVTDGIITMIIITGIYHCGYFRFILSSNFIC